MKEMNFEEIASMYDPLIKSQIRLYKLTRNFDQYYQAGLLGLWKAYESFNPEKGQFSSNAFLLVRGRILQELRSEARRQERETSQDPHEYGALRTLSFQDHIPLLEDELLNECIMHLTENQKRWVIHRVIHFKSEKEIAQMFHVTIYAVKSWRKAALKKLRSVLNTQ
ncbi:sigma-70 family RNA polymerase sigma factor [Fictibacillus nanhaiensis]|uniref:sigma-70 family RNA polymerase sigma factor n=1 Tax=Fictibacillus nanhaiensis TaxID=742169 RepID=UPI001C946A00|nr:sigma-70 family RNA polymerase sigma factor [Fictibacillus nanhaiensis]MBY6037243.1 sigma-70 family RNA polymerase sigma factor [Fictibacillus nanhaiensis]